MSVRSYLDAGARYRDSLDLLGRYRGTCASCGHPDARHRDADSITGRLFAGDDVESVADDFLPPDLGVIFRQDMAMRVAFYTLATDPRLHDLTRGRAADLDREAWADLLGGPTRDQPADAVADVQS